MNGFDIEHNLEALEETITARFEEGEMEVIKVLSSPGYNEIIAGFNVRENLSEIEISFKEGIVIENQNVFQTLAYGGSFLKRVPGEEDKYIDVPPSITLQKYIGKR